MANNENIDYLKNSGRYPKTSVTEVLVPKSQLSNEEWNKAVAALNDLKEANDTLSSSVSQLDEDFDELSSDVSSIDGRLEDIEDEFTGESSEVDATPELHDGYINGNTGEIVKSSTVNYYSDSVDCSGYEYVKFAGVTLASSSTAYFGYAFYNSAGTFISGSVFDKTGSEIAEKEYTVSIPSNASSFRVTCRKDKTSSFFVKLKKSGSGLKDKIIKLSAQARGSRSIYPFVDYSSLNNGKISYTKKLLKRRVSTPRYFRISGNDAIIIKVSIACNITLALYDESFCFINSETKSNITANQSCEISCSGASYAKIMLVGNGDTSSSPVYLNLPILEVNGVFADNWDCFNERPSDSGYQPIVSAVTTSDMTTCVSSSGSVQDSPTLNEDYGLLALPSTYHQEGTPTRLIIWCHGAGTSFPTPDNRFVSLTNEYWLKEGYAVLDCNGDPYNTQDGVNNGVPQSYEAYLAAYKWAIERYNIRRDGVFLGGRSMGGGTALGILMQGHIPVLGLCTICGAVNKILSFSQATTLQRSYIVTRFGMSGTFTETSNNPMSASEYNYLKSNFGKLAQYVGFLKAIQNLPSADVIMSSNTNSHNATDATEAAVFDGLRAKLPCPFKAFITENDSKVTNARHTKYLHEMLLRGGSVSELRSFPFGDHSPESYYKTSVTTRFGETLSDVPVPYIEIMMFWRRYEQ